jgi:hypothetical protein
VSKPSGHVAAKIRLTQYHLNGAALTLQLLDAVMQHHQLQSLDRSIEAAIERRRRSGPDDKVPEIKSPVTTWSAPLQAMA